MGLTFALTFLCARHSFAINALDDEEHPLLIFRFQGSTHRLVGPLFEARFLRWWRFHGQ